MPKKKGAGKGKKKGKGKGKGKGKKAAAEPKVEPPGLQKMPADLQPLRRLRPSAAGPGTNSRRRECHSAASPSPCSRRFNRDGVMERGCPQNDSLADGQAATLCRNPTAGGWVATALFTMRCLSQPTRTVRHNTWVTPHKLTTKGIGCHTIDSLFGVVSYGHTIGST